MAESRFPMHFDKCPLCGSKEQVVRLGWDEEADTGRVERDTQVCSQIYGIPLYNPIKPPVFQCGVLQIMKEICAGCGYEYIYNVVYAVSPVTAVTKPPPGQGQAPFSPS